MALSASNRAVCGTSRVPRIRSDPHFLPLMKIIVTYKNAWYDASGLAISIALMVAACEEFLWSTEGTSYWVA